MRVVTISPEINAAREKFFRGIFGDTEGYVCLAVRAGGKSFREEYFKYPANLPQALEFINRSFHGQNMYFCPQLLRTPKRDKANVMACTCVWSDLDECNPDIVQPEPSIVLETSPGRWQGFWLLDEPAAPLDAEDASHRLANAYKSFGADQSGWDLSQLLRIPLTYNVKYEMPGNVPIVQVTVDTGRKYSIQDFQSLPEVPGFEWTNEPIPDVSEMDPDVLLEKHHKRLDPQVTVLYTVQPKSDWSGALWNLECLLIEAGLTKEETFAIAKSAACNKFERDGLEDKYLWQDVCRAASRIQLRLADAVVTQPLQPLLSDEERTYLESLPKGFVEEYIDWARSRGDAAWQYHEAGAFIILSQLLSGVVKLPTSFGVMVPNLWFMILADTTLTRKSTAMDMAVEMLLQVDPDAVLATDGSLEGLLSGISVRPNRPGIFWRDEFSGLLEMIRKKDYYAGMIESLTKLYDGKYQKRMLRKEIIEIRDPILIIFCGGIRTRILSQMDIEYVLSGFMPRFIFVQAMSNIDKYQPIGPMTDFQDDVRGTLVTKMSQMKEAYAGEMTVKIGEQTIKTMRTWDVVLEPDVWNRYNQFERSMVQYGVESPNPEVYTPVLDRLSKSGLKVAMLIAASRQRPQDDKVHLEMQDMLKAIKFVEGWRGHNLDVAANVGKTVHERQMDNILTFILRSPNGIARSRVMQNYHLTAREAEFILETLEQRGQIRRVKNGKLENLFPALLG